MMPLRRAGGLADALRPRRHFNSGQAMTEYLILGMLIAIVLVVGEPSPLEQLIRAIQAHYGRFTLALSLP